MDHMLLETPQAREAARATEMTPAPAPAERARLAEDTAGTARWKYWGAVSV